jgi:hypothetical protein
LRKLFEGREENHLGNSSRSSEKEIRNSSKLIAGCKRNVLGNQSSSSKRESGKDLHRVEEEAPRILSSSSTRENTH